MGSPIPAGRMKTHMKVLTVAIFVLVLHCVESKRMFGGGGGRRRNENSRYGRRPWEAGYVGNRNRQRRPWDSDAWRRRQDPVGQWGMGKNVFYPGQPWRNQKQNLKVEEEQCVGLCLVRKMEKLEAEMRKDGKKGGKKGRRKGRNSNRRVKGKITKEGNKMENVKSILPLLPEKTKETNNKPCIGMCALMRSRTGN